MREDEKTLDTAEKIWYNKARNGALAQLGAHNTGSVGVTGSNPVRSTTKKGLPRG